MSSPLEIAQSQGLIWQQPGWPSLLYDSKQVAAALGLAFSAQGAVEGKLAAIEGERLDLEAVRSSIACRLGVPAAKATSTPRHVDGLLDVMDDAMSQPDKPVTHERLHAWQTALFPTGFSSVSRIRIGGYREHAEPMQIVSGRIGRETVHYQAALGGCTGRDGCIPDVAERFQ